MDEEETAKRLEPFGLSIIKKLLYIIQESDSGNDKHAQGTNKTNDNCTVSLTRWSWPWRIQLGRVILPVENLISTGNENTEFIPNEDAFLVRKHTLGNNTDGTLDNNKDLCMEDISETLQSDTNKHNYDLRSALGINSGIALLAMAVVLPSSQEMIMPTSTVLPSTHFSPAAYSSVIRNKTQLLSNYNDSRNVSQEIDRNDESIPTTSSPSSRSHSICPTLSDKNEDRENFIPPRKFALPCSNLDLCSGEWKAEDEARCLLEKNVQFRETYNTSLSLIKQSCDTQTKSRTRDDSTNKVSLTNNGNEIQNKLCLSVVNEKSKRAECFHRTSVKGSFIQQHLLASKTNGKCVKNESPQNYLASSSERKIKKETTLVEYLISDFSSRFFAKTSTTEKDQCINNTETAIINLNTPHNDFNKACHAIHHSIYYDRCICEYKGCKGTKCQIRF